MLAVHIVLSLCFILNVPLPLFNQNTLLGYYKSYAALGPFFTDKSVSSTYLMGVSFKTEDWSPWAFPQLTSHQNYLDQLDYEQLKRAEFEKLLSWYALSANQQTGIQDYLTQYLTTRYSTNEHIDSVGLMVLKRSGSNLEVQTDTLSINFYPVE